MHSSFAVPQAGMYVIRGCLIVSIQAELYDDVIHQIQQNILEKVHQSRIRGVILDVSMVEVMDSHIAASFCESAQMLGLLGAQTVLVGMRPAVASALMDLETPPLDLQTTITLEQALTMLEPYARANERATGDAEDESELLDAGKGIAPEDDLHASGSDINNAIDTQVGARNDAGATRYE